MVNLNTSVGLIDAFHNSTWGLLGFFLTQSTPVNSKSSLNALLPGVENGGELYTYRSNSLTVRLYEPKSPVIVEFLEMFKRHLALPKVSYQIPHGISLAFNYQKRIRAVSCQQ